ncbi:MAG: hypothetical protein ABEH43_08645 [Flavobacteriales bacterium]
MCYELHDDNFEREVNGVVNALKQFKLKEGVIITLDQKDSLTIDNQKVKIVPFWEEM